jgi:hypothetical protein
MRRWIGYAMLLALASTAYADVVELDTGERVTGDLKETSLDKVVVEVQGRLVSYDRARVRAIFLTSPPARTVAPAPAPAEALVALKEIQSLLSGPSRTLPAYTAQVTQSRAAVDTYLKATPATAAARSPIADALALYEFAAKVWESRLTNIASASAEIGRNPIVDQCASLQKILAAYPAPTSQESAWRRGVALEFEIPSIWTCAGEKIAEADALATKGAQAPASR